MKNKRSYYIPVVMAILIVSCTKDPDPDRTDKHSFTSKDAIIMDLDVKKNDSYRVREFEIDEAKLAAAFGGATPATLLFYAVNSDGTKLVGEDEYTSEYGFYFTSSGYVCMPSAGDCAFFVEYYGSSEGYDIPTIGIGQYPGSCEVGDTATLTVGLADTITGQPFKLKINIVEAGEWAVYFENSDGMTYTVYQTLTDDYKPLEVVVNQSALCSALGLSSVSDIVTGFSNGNITFIGINSDSSQYTTGYTANSGHWFNAGGDVCSWGADSCSIYSEWYGAAPVSFFIGQYPSGIEVGDKFTIRQALVYRDHTAILTFKIRIVEEVTDDLGPDESGDQ